jgi:hypothetical protein
MVDKTWQRDGAIADTVGQLPICASAVHRLLPSMLLSLCASGNNLQRVRASCQPGTCSKCCKLQRVVVPASKNGQPMGGLGRVSCTSTIAAYLLITRQGLLIGCSYAQKVSISRYRASEATGEAGNAGRKCKE